MIEINNISFRYPNTDNKVLCDITYRFENGMIYGLIGQNGVGKTTLLECLDGTLKVLKGTIKIDNTDYTIEHYLNNPLIILNNNKLFYNDLKVIEHFYLLKRYYKDLDIFKQLEAFNLNQYREHYPHELSLGTSQRFSLSLRLCHPNHNILADEPFNGLDLLESNKLQKYFSKLRNDQGTIIVSSHDIMSLSTLCDVILLLKDGKLIEVNTSDLEALGNLYEYHE